ncbi:MAG: hypothetical protein IKW48_05975 [Akkermansia sp.]|nr:hypothetical protein [Akkermansia sp.]
MDLCQMMYTSLMLVSMFVALLWLKPGKREAARYGMILVPYGGLLYLIYLATQEMGVVGYYLREHLPCSAALLVYLLGLFMLKCPWKRALQSCGVYALVHAPLFVLYVLYIHGFSVELLLGAPGQILMIWLFVWLCARHLSAKQGLLSAATIEACEGLVIANVVRYIPVLFGLGLEATIVVGTILKMLIWMLAFALVMHHLHGKSWKRSIAFSFSPLLLAVILSVLRLIIRVI